MLDIFSSTTLNGAFRCVGCEKVGRRWVAIPFSFLQKLLKSEWTMFGFNQPNINLLAKFSIRVQKWLISRAEQISPCMWRFPENGNNKCMDRFPFQRIRWNSLTSAWIRSMLLNYWIVQWSSQPGNDKPYCSKWLPATHANAPTLWKNFDVFQWNFSIPIFHFVTVSEMK